MQKLTRTIKNIFVAACALFIMLGLAMSLYMIFSGADAWNNAPGCDIAGNCFNPYEDAEPQTLSRLPEASNYSIQSLSEVDVAYEYVGDEEQILSREEAINQYWYEIKDYLDGTESIDAFSYNSGSYYNLEANILGGQLDTLYFPSGGHLYFGAEFDESGNASEIDIINGSPWDFELDMDSSLVDDAINNWAENNGYIIE